MTAYLTAKEVGQRLGVKASTIKRWAGQGWIPCVRLSYRVLRFDYDEVRQAITKRATRRHSTEQKRSILVAGASD